MTNLSVSDRIAKRLRAAGAGFLANDNIAAFIEPGELGELEIELTVRVEAMLRSLVIDVYADHNTADTPRRVARMMLREIYAGRYNRPPVVTAFPNVQHVDQCYVVGPIAVRSCCAHHLVPIIGECWIGTIPSDDVLIGLSKHHRLVEWIMSRPQIQEEAAHQLADEIEAAIGHPKGLGIIIKAKHLCCAWRGVRDGDSLMTTSVMRGLFKTDHKARDEFLALTNGMGYR